MAHANHRFTVGVAVVAACLLLGGPSAAVAIADSGGRHSGHSGSGNTINSINSGSRGSTNSNSDGRPSSRVGSGRDAGTSKERPSSDYSPAPSGQGKAPKVTFGDGRTPGIQDHDPEPRRRWSAPEPAPPPPPPEVITVPLNPPTVNPVREQTRVVQQLVVSPTAGLGDPLWGVAGLLLIPAAGAILGYRQERAAKAAAQLGSHP